MTPLEQVRAIYAELPPMVCKGMCSNSCGPIDMSDAERSRLVELGVEIPVFTQEASRRWDAGARLDCPALSSFRTCAVYQDRPLICRLWGMAESMPCPHGCGPRKLLTDEEAYDMIFRVMEAGGQASFGPVEGVRKLMEEFQADPNLGPLFARFIRGDKTVEPLIVAEVAKRRR